MTDDDLAKSIDRIARSGDGRDLYLFLQKTVCDLAPGECTDGALREFEGRRRFASELMAMMAKGIIESGGRDNQPIVFGRPERAASSGQLSAREYFRRKLADESAAGE